MGKKQSRFGIASIILCLLVLIFIFVGVLVNLTLSSFIHGKYHLFDLFRDLFTFPVACFSAITLSVLALGSGIAGLLEKNRNKFLAILGIVISILFLPMEIFAYYMLEAFSHMEL